MRRTLIAVVGPTCTGKTGVSVALAERLTPAELINADSRQLLRGLAVGTCAPTPAQLRGVTCHLLDLADPGEQFSVAAWTRAARAVVADLESRRVLGVAVGGTGLYITALVDGLDFADVPPDPRTRAVRTAQAATPGGLSALADQIRKRDPGGAQRLDLRNPRRVVRALEILDARPGILAELQQATPRHDTLLIGLDVPHDVHAAWIAERTSRMFRDGALFDEVSAARTRGVSDTALTASGIGYVEAIGVMDGTLRVDDAIARTVQRTLRYAKSQRTYWRRDTRIEWDRADTLDTDRLATLAVAEAEARPHQRGV